MRTALYTPLGVTLGILFVFQGLFAVHAAEPSCQFQKQIEELAIKKKLSGSDSLTRIREELTVRKNLLRDIIDCATREAETLKEKLSMLTLYDQDTARAQTRLADELSKTISFYGRERVRINDVGLRASQDTARSIREWRRGNYASLADQTVNFIIWANNQDLMKTAERRLAELHGTVKTVKLSESEDIGTLVKKAREHLTAALSENERARKTFIDDALRGARNPSLSLASIKSSLQSLAETYQTFFDLRKLLKE